MDMETRASAGPMSSRFCVLERLRGELPHAEVVRHLARETDRQGWCADVLLDPDADRVLVYIPGHPRLAIRQKRVANAAEKQVDDLY